MPSSDNTIYTLCIPFTFGNNGEKKGVTEQQVFWHMRNLKIGHIESIDLRQYTDKNGVNVHQWFVHFSSWTADTKTFVHLESDNYLKITYDNYGHFWKVFRYTPPIPSAPTEEQNFEFGFNLTKEELVFGDNFIDENSVHYDRLNSCV